MDTFMLLLPFSLDMSELTTQLWITFHWLKYGYKTWLWWYLN